MFRDWRGPKKKILSQHKESNLKPSYSAIRCSTTEPQRLYGERGLLRSSYDTHLAYRQDEKHLSITGNVVGNQIIKGLVLIVLTELLHSTDGAHEYT